MNVDLKTFPLQANPVAKFYSESGTLVDTETGTESATVKGTYRFQPTLADGYYDYTIALPGDGSSAGAIHVVGQVVVAYDDNIANLQRAQSDREAVSTRASQASVNAISLTGSGARSVTITVTDGTDPLASALVRVTSGANSFTSLTNGSGVVVFNLDDGSWIVGITKSGYAYAGSTIVVDGTETRTLAMTAISFPSSPAGQVTGYWYIYDESGALDAGAKVDIEAANLPRTSTGLVLQDSVRQVTANGSGLLTVTGLFPGVTYKVHRQNSSREFLITVPVGSISPVALGSIVG